MICRVTAYLRPHKTEEVKTAVTNIGISGLTVTDVRGRGSSVEQSSNLIGEEILVALPVRTKLEVVVEKSLVEPVIEAILASGRTGRPGDGKIFVQEILDVVRIRTEERGSDAV